MKTIKLYGSLAKKFGKEFKLDVASPAEAIRALCAIVPGFKRHLSEHSEPGYTVRVGSEFKDADGLRDPVGKQEVIKISPVLAGSNAVTRVIVGTLLIVAGFFLPPALAPFAWSTGASLVLGGVAEMLTPKPKLKSTERPENEPSYTFNGAVNTVGQGNAVPVGYGELIIGSQLISAQITTENIKVV